MLNRRLRMAETSCWLVGTAPVAALRVETSDRTFSYLAGEVRSWVLRPGESADILIIRAGKETFTVRGAGLEQVRDALEQQRLRVLSMSIGRAVQNSEVRIESIEVNEA